MSKYRDLSHFYKKQPPYLIELEELIPNYLNNIQKDNDKLKEAISQKNTAAVKAVAHKVKGSALSYGFEVIDEVMVNIQKATVHEDWSEIRSQQGFLENYLLFVREFINAKGIKDDR